MKSRTKAIEGVALKSVQSKSLDLGVMQTEVENSTKDLKKKIAELQRANEAHAAAEERYIQANKALCNGMNTLRASTKITL